MARAIFHEARKYLTVGVANTIVSLLVIYAAKWFFNLGDAVANLIGYSAGFFLSFTLNSRWTFVYRGPYLSTLVKFMLIVFIAYGANLLTVLVTIHYFGLNGYVAQAMGIAPYTLTSFLGSKYLVFRT